MNNYLTKEECELSQRARLDAMKRAWLKPRIKRQAGTWVCCGRGVAAAGHSPRTAHSSWLLALQIQVTYAQSGKVADRC